MGTMPGGEELNGTVLVAPPPGRIHSTHQVIETKNYVFCAICGTYGKQLRRSQLRAVCPRRPRNRYAGIARDKLMLGEEPFGRTWMKTSDSAVHYFAD